MEASNNKRGKSVSNELGVFIRFEAILVSSWQNGAFLALVASLQFLNLPGNMVVLLVDHVLPVPIRQFFFYFLVYGSSDPNFCILEKK